MPASKPIPESLGKYEVISEVARGSMGIVYLGHDPYIDRDVALKLALSEMLNDPDTGERFRKMFFNEAHTAGMLQHPNILDIFDAGVDGDHCFLVMEYIDGGKTLRSHTNKDTLLPIKTAVEMIFKCAKALDYAHKKGVIHRDIKPSNLLITPDNDIKIADFSIAHINRQDQTQTMPLGFVGSPRYMSPEQIHEDYITHHTDLFSLGVIFYELLTGAHPFSSNSFSQLIYKVVYVDPEPMSNARGGLTEELERIVFRLLEKDPGKRYQSGLDLASDLSASFSYLDSPQELISLNERASKIRRLSFFAGFKEEEIWEIIKSGLWVSANAGDAIVTEGDFDDSLYVLIDGQVSVLKGDHQLGMLERGDCFGEMAYIAGSKRSASIIANSNVNLLKLSSTLMEKTSTDCQLKFCKIFMKTLIKRLSETSEKVARKTHEDETTH